MRLFRFHVVFRLVAVFAPALACAGQGATWRVTPVGESSWYGVSCAGIDAKGRIAGSANVGNDQFGYAAFYDDGRSTRTWGSAGAEKDGGEAHGLNDKGLVVGNRITDRVFGTRHAVVFRANGPRDLPFLAPGVAHGGALAVNAAGDIVGFAMNAAGDDHAVRWQGDTVVDLAPASRDSYAAAINASGMIVGKSDGTLVSFPEAGPAPLAGLEGAFGEVYAVNAAGVVAGHTVDANSMKHAFTWQAGTVTPLATPDGMSSFALGLNNTGGVVGFVTHGPDNTGVVWQDGTLIVLDDALAPGSPEGWHIADAQAINDAGQICAIAVKAHKYARAVLLTPVR